MRKGKKVILGATLPWWRHPLEIESVTTPFFFYFFFSWEKFFPMASSFCIFLSFPWWKETGFLN